MDHLGTPQALTDPQQTVVWQARYNSFGRADVQAVAVNNDGSVVTASNRTNQGDNKFSWIGSAHASVAPHPAAGKTFEFNLRFAGQYEDTETGYHYNWNRYSDPQSGHYITPDPIGLQGGANAYGYVGADPFGAVDPWGLLRLVVGIEMPPEYAIVGPNRTHDLTTGQYGHGFAYLVDDDNKIVNSVSPAPAGAGNNIWDRPGTADYAVTDPSSLFGFDISQAQYDAINKSMNDFRADVPAFRVTSNSTCTRNALDVLRNVGVNLPNGVGPVKVPLSIIGSAVVNAVNPVALHDQLVAAGYKYTAVEPFYFGENIRPPGVTPAYQITNGATDPFSEFNKTSNKLP